jgi:hypothetical protein
MAYPNRFISNKKFVFLLLAVSVATGLLFLVQWIVAENPDALLGDDSQREIEWIELSDPKKEARMAYASGNIKFLEIYVAKDTVDGPKGEWKVAGANSIPPSILNSHSERLRIQSTCNWGFTTEQRAFWEKAESFAGKYNNALSELIEKSPR